MHLRPLLTEKHHLSLPGHWDQGKVGEVCTTCLHQIQRYVSPEMIIPIKEQKQPAKTTIVSKKVAKKVQLSQKNWEIGQPSQII